jgi:hypothetical protein
VAGLLLPSLAPLAPLAPRLTSLSLANLLLGHSGAAALATALPRLTSLTLASACPTQGFDQHGAHTAALRLPSLQLLRLALPRLRDPTAPTPLSWPWHSAAPCHAAPCTSSGCS